ncbi:MAG: carbohydrate kinase family protein [Nocardioides sp.]
MTAAHDAVHAAAHEVAPARERVVVVGGANVDILARSLDPALPATSNPGTTSTTPGGVGRNIAENLARLGWPVTLLAQIGADSLGDLVRRSCESAGVDATHLVTGSQPTGSYTAVIDHDGELVVAVADMTATDEFRLADVPDAADHVAAAALVVADANLSADTLAELLDLAAAAGVPVVIEPVSEPKAKRLWSVLDPARPVHTLTPNRAELLAMTGAADVAAAAATLHAVGVGRVWCHHRDGSTMFELGREPQHLQIEPIEAVDVTGAGDALVAAYCHGVVHGIEPLDAAAFGHRVAALTVTSPHTVHPRLGELVPTMPEERS